MNIMTEKESSPVRVRMAPSPTGYLHLGTIRTALFNFLFARKEKGVFVVRIEDTDKERSKSEYEKDILDGLRSLGITWDEGPGVEGPRGPYHQSERGDIYEKHIQRLLQEKKAYWCFCTKEELEEERNAMLAAGLFPKYSGKCRHLSDEEISARRVQGEGVIRLTVLGGVSVEFSDIIRGKISVNSDTIGDIVIAKDEQSPLYNCAVVIDDEEMKITHVIRGEDHISNTPKQILIARALGFASPKYAHLPLILAPDRSKLSKRSLETSFNEYLKIGYVPEAVLNFLVLLGWNPGDEQELLSLDEMIARFDIRKVQKAGAIFNMDKLDWFNAQYIKRLSNEELAARLQDFIPAQWIDRRHILLGAIELERDRIKKLSEFRDNAAFLFELPEYERELLCWKEMGVDAVRSNLGRVRDSIELLDESAFTVKMLENAFAPLTEELGRGEVLWPARVAVSGLRNSPGPFEIMNILGKGETLNRLHHALAKIGQAELL